MRKFTVIALALVAAVGLSASSASSARTENGVTAKSITIGGTFPLSGPASGYATIPAAMKAYFSYINARRGPDGKRGVYGRQIIWKYQDDQYSPPQSVQLTRGLVENDKVFAIVGSLGTEVNLAIRPYLNQLKVPHMLVSTGATTWGADWKQYPWTTGWQPAYQLEGRFYGETIARSSPNGKIGVLYQNDDYGKDYITGLEAGLGSKASNIVDKEPFEVTATSVAAQITKLKASGANIFVILATPTKTIQAYATATALKWLPAVVYTNSVSATDTFLTIAKTTYGAGELTSRTFTFQYAKDPANPKWDNDAAMKLYKQIMAKYYPKGRVTDALNMYGVATAEAFTQLLYKAGKNPTRQSLIDAFRNWNQANQFLLPGVKQRTSKSGSQFPIKCEQLVKFSDAGVFQPVSATRCSASGT
jgi:branched-chain amino acid transport system substrate-binding protein